MANNNRSGSAPAASEGVDTFGLAFEKGRDYSVSAPFVAPNGKTVVFTGPDLEANEFPPLNAPLPDYVTLAETVVEPDSFIDYITNFKSSTAICRASLGRNRIECVLDFHGRARQGERDSAVPNHASFAVTLTTPFDLDYLRWRTVFLLAAEGKGPDQKGLANFIEDMLYTIGEPPAADILDAISDLKIDRQIRFKSARNERNGNIQFAYDEVDDDKVSGTVALPDHFTVIVPIFQGGNPQQLDVRVRYRLDKGAVTFLLSVAGLDNIERLAFRSIAERVRTETQTPVYYTA